jgi:hypothetical protein
MASPQTKHDSHTPIPQPTTGEPLLNILKKHNTKLQLHGIRGGSYKEMAEDLVTQLEMERHRTNAVVSNLNAILNQYQVTAASLRQLQQSQEQTVSKAQQALLDLGTQDEDIDPDTKE